MKPVIKIRLSTPLNVAALAWPLVICGLMVATSIVTLWPFEFMPTNRVRQTPGGLVFDGRGIAYTEETLQWPGRTSTPPLSLELWIEPTALGPEGNGVILSLDDNTTYCPLHIGQWHGGLSYLQWRTTSHGRMAVHTPSMKALLSPGPHHVVLTSGNGESILYLDGKATKVRSRYPATMTFDELRARLVLGNTPTGSQPWTGTILSVAIYSQALSPETIARRYHQSRFGNSAQLGADDDFLASYSFDTATGSVARPNRPEHPVQLSPPIVMPHRFEPPRREVLSLPNGRDLHAMSFYQDVFLNVMGFVPLGWAASRWGQQHGWPMNRHVLLAIFVGTILSLCIELLQALEPNRDSSATDLLSNMLGTALGALLARATGIHWAAAAMNRSSGRKQRTV